MFALDGFDHLALAVADVESSVAWYAEVLGFKRLHEGMWDGIPVFIGNGPAAIALFPAKSNIPSEQQSGALLHFAFRVTHKNFLASQRELTSRGMDFEFQDHGIAHSIYFRDPDGYQIEITTYEL